jgi:hypothetical protein
VPIAIAQSNKLIATAPLDVTKRIENRAKGEEARPTVTVKVTVQILMTVQVKVRGLKLSLVSETWGMRHRA